MSIASKLQDILAAKSDIKDAINAKGGTITDATPLDEYAQAIEDLPSGDDSLLISILNRSATTLDLSSLNLTELNDYAICYFPNLTAIILPETLTTIGRCGIYENRKLTGITIPNTVTSIGQAAFQFCGYNATTFTVNMSNNVVSVGIDAFRACIKTTSLHFPDTLTTIGNSAFSYMHALTDVYIGTGIQTIGSNLFLGRGIASPITLRIAATTPPTLGTGLFVANTTYKIYVPDASVNDYKTATNWSTWASFIYPLSDYTP